MKGNTEIIYPVPTHKHAPSVAVHEVAIGTVAILHAVYEVDIGTVAILHAVYEIDIGIVAILHAVYEIDTLEL